MAGGGKKMLPGVEVPGPGRRFVSVLPVIGAADGCGDGGNPEPKAGSEPDRAEEKGEEDDAIHSPCCDSNTGFSSGN